MDTTVAQKEQTSPFNSTQINERIESLKESILEVERDKSSIEAVGTEGEVAEIQVTLQLLKKELAETLIEASRNQ